MQKKYILPLSAALAVLSMGVATGSQAQAVSCGDVITTPTTLDSDLVCTIADEFSVAIAIEGPSGSLSMGDYSLTCSTNKFGTGIILLESGARLSGGSVIGCGDAVTVVGDGGHYVTGVTITDSGNNAVYVKSNFNVVSSMTITGGSGVVDEGILIQGNNNLVNNNFVGNTDNPGIEITGAYNHVYFNEVYFCATDGIVAGGIFSRVTHNTSNFNGYQGISVAGSYGTIAQNKITDNDFAGIQILQGEFNNIANNNVVDNGTYGIYIADSMPTDNTISGNFSKGHTYDLYDPENFACISSNTWINNTFTTSDPGCLD
ncbi:right-handed parallel beta-helix repeat-containing protein [Microbulbifer sp. SSSA005]|uniref:right-handed parallel beta-helix repeat-containing protein n=1 Tax=unclassified Microbulbifer TaxID=2619833 RepID=UPI00403A3BEE